MKKRYSLICNIIFIFFIVISLSYKVEAASPISSYKGANGVEIRSYSQTFSSQEKLKMVYDELLNNTIGEEIKYLSHIELIDDYPYGKYTTGMYYRFYTGDTLSKDNYIQIYGCKNIKFTTLARVLSHEYGHHFTIYHAWMKEGKELESKDTGYYKLRNLGSYKKVENGEHSWAISEIAAEDYVQLFGSPTGKNSIVYRDIRDNANGLENNIGVYSSLEGFNSSPQENEEIPNAWNVNGLYDYWLNISKVKPKYSKPGTIPFLYLEDYNDGKYTFKWTKSIDDNTENMEYTTLIEDGDLPNIWFGKRTTTDSIGRDFITGKYKEDGIIYSDNIKSNIFRVKVNAKDKDGNLVSSNIVSIDKNNPQKSIAHIPNRIEGKNRYDTSSEISKNGWVGNSQYVILVSGENFPDALSAVPYAKKYNAPILLIEKNYIDKSIESELKRLKPSNAIIVGGRGSISQNIENKIKSMGMTTKRIWGNDRYETSLEVLKDFGNFKEVIITSGENFPDALSASSVAATKGIPIILSSKAGLEEDIIEYLKEKEVEKAYIVGGEKIITPLLERSLSIDSERIYGKDRYETNLLLLDRFEKDLDFNKVYLASGQNFPDALSGSAYAALSKSPLVLSNNSNLKYLKNKGISLNAITVLGGENSIPTMNLLQ